MELKDRLGYQASRPIQRGRNPFNGIESTTTALTLLPSGNTTNPFNGIESPMPTSPPCASADLLNPFNGIERKLLKTVALPTLDL